MAAERPLKKVLFVIESLAGGGAEKVLSVLAEHFQNNSISISILSIVNIGVYASSIPKNIDYKYIIPNTTSPNIFIRLWAKILYRLIYKWLSPHIVSRLFFPKDYDTIIAFVEGFTTKLVSQLDVSTNCKRIAWVHCDLLEYPWTVNNGIFKNADEEKQAYSKFQNIVVVSENAKNNFIKKYGLSDRVLFIQNPIDRDKIICLSHEPCELGISKTTRFISIGRLVEAKGYCRLIEACKRLCDEGFDFEMFILGDGNERQKLETMVSQNKLSGTIHLCGFQTNPYKYLRCCDYFICSSLSEGYSLAIAESMCIGLPVISTRCAGPIEILKHGDYGLLVDNSINGLYDGMKKFLSNDYKDYYSNLSLKRSLDFGVDKCLSDIYAII